MLKAIFPVALGIMITITLVLFLEDPHCLLYIEFNQADMMNTYLVLHCLKG